MSSPPQLDIDVLPLDFQAAAQESQNDHENGLRRARGILYAKMAKSSMLHAALAKKGFHAALRSFPSLRVFAALLDDPEKLSATLVEAGPALRGTLGDACLAANQGESAAPAPDQESPNSISRTSSHSPLSFAAYCNLWKQTAILLQHGAAAPDGPAADAVAAAWIGRAPLALAQLAAFGCDMRQFKPDAPHGSTLLIRAMGAISTAKGDACCKIMASSAQDYPELSSMKLAAELIEAAPARHKNMLLEIIAAREAAQLSSMTPEKTKRIEKARL